MSTLPHDVTDLHLAPVLLALDARLAEMSLLNLDELVQRIAIDSDCADWTEDMRESGLLDTVRHVVDLRGWTLSWDPRGLRIHHGRHHVVLGIPGTFRNYIDGGHRAAREQHHEHGRQHRP